MKHQKTITLLFLMLLIGSMFFSLLFGRYAVSLWEAVEAMLKLFGKTDADVSPEAFAFITQFRLPRIIAGAFVGAGLAASGAAFQGIFHNPLVSPSILGVSAGAGFGASLSILLSAGFLSVYISAFAFGLLAVAFTYWIATIYKTTPTIMLVLGGTIVSSVFNSLISLIKYTADAERQLPEIVYWLMGSLSSTSFDDFWALIPISIGLIILTGLRWRVNVLSMGDKEAQAMGLNVRIVKSAIIVGASLATAGAVCISGVIGWVGLVIPHIGRMIAGNDNRRLIPLSMIIGAAFMVIIDSLSRTITKSEIPLGILTSLIGAPFFIFILKKTKGGSWQS